MLKTIINLKLPQLVQYLEFFLCIVFRILEKNIVFFNNTMQLVRKYSVYLSTGYFIFYHKKNITTTLQDLAYLIKIFFNNSGVKRLIRFQDHTRLQADNACTKIHTESWSCHSVSDYQHLLA